MNKLWDVIVIVMSLCQRLNQMCRVANDDSLFASYFWWRDFYTVTHYNIHDRKDTHLQARYWCSVIINSHPLLFSGVDCATCYGVKKEKRADQWRTCTVGGWTRQIAPPWRLASPLAPVLLSFIFRKGKSPWPTILSKRADNEIYKIKFNLRVGRIEKNHKMRMKWNQRFLKPSRIL